jgi:hypothetical protein
MSGGIITRSAHPSLLWPGIKALFGHKYNEQPAQWSQIFDKRDSDKAYEKVVEITGFGLASTKGESQSVAYDSEGEGITSQFQHVVYGLGYQVTKEEIEDNLYAEVAARRSRGLAYSMKQTAEIVHANVLNRAFNSSYAGGDGVELCSASHPTRSGNQSNLLNAADLSESAIEDAVKTIRQVSNARGLKIMAKPVRLITSTDDMFNATRIFKSDMRVGTANNDINAIRVMGSIPEIVDNVFLTDMDAWFVQTDVPEGMLSFWRREVELSKDQDFDTENAKAKATMRFSCGWGDFRAIFGSSGS